MKRIIENLPVDLFAIALMAAMVATGYILRFPLPPGTNKTLSLWSLTRHQWGTLHFWISLALLAIILVHLYLHWQWIVISVKRRFGGTTASSSSHLVSGLVTVLVLTVALVLLGWAAQSSVKPVTEPIEGVCPPLEGEKGTSAVHSRTPTTEHPRIAFWKDVYPILERSCISCHGPSRQAGGFRVDRREDFFAGNGKEVFVVPDNSQQSPLVALLSSERKDVARAGVHQLSKRELAILEAWINAGAKWPDREG